MQSEGGEDWEDGMAEVVQYEKSRRLKSPDPGLVGTLSCFLSCNARANAPKTQISKYQK